MFSWNRCVDRQTLHGLCVRLPADSAPSLRTSAALLRLVGIQLGIWFIYLFRHSSPKNNTSVLIDSPSCSFLLDTELFRRMSKLLFFLYSEKLQKGHKTTILKGSEWTLLLWLCDFILCCGFFYVCQYVECSVPHVFLWIFILFYVFIFVVYFWL